MSTVRSRAHRERTPPGAQLPCHGQCALHAWLVTQAQHVRLRCRGVVEHVSGVCRALAVAQHVHPHPQVEVVAQALPSARGAAAAGAAAPADAPPGGPGGAPQMTLPEGRGQQGPSVEVSPSGPAAPGGGAQGGAGGGRGGSLGAAGDPTSSAAGDLAGATSNVVPRGDPTRDPLRQQVHAWLSQRQMPRHQHCGVTAAQARMQRAPLLYQHSQSADKSALVKPHPLLALLSSWPHVFDWSTTCCPALAVSSWA